MASKVRSTVGMASSPVVEVGGEAVNTVRGSNSRGREMSCYLRSGNWRDWERGLEGFESEHELTSKEGEEINRMLLAVGKAVDSGRWTMDNANVKCRCKCKPVFALCHTDGSRVRE